MGPSKEEGASKILKVEGQAHFKGTNENDKLMGAWSFWDMAAASIKVPEGEDEMTAIYVEITTWGTSEAAKEINIFDTFQAFLEGILAKYDMRLGQMFEQQQKQAAGKTLRKNHQQKLEGSEVLPQMI